jgi:glycosyltransferase involved in cell wall biosynthesis
VSGLQRVAFYAPLKSPNHPSPSGDRTMARLLMKALGAAGFSVFLASEIRTLDKGGDPARQERLRDESEAVARELTERVRSLPPHDRPALWFTYHVYYKAPDWIGPRIADSLGIPYVIAEGSRAAKRAHGPWALGHAGAEAALDRADAIVTMTARDRIALEAARPARQVLVDLPPFLDPAEWGNPPIMARPAGIPRLLTVAMMREGDKLASYRILAAALARIGHLAWTLDIVGDGEARGEIGNLFGPFGPRIRFHGQMEAGHALRALYERADLFVWPAVNEAYGMVLLEAQLFGCPIVAGDYGGVASVMKHDETGLLAPPGDIHAFAQAVAGLIGDRDRRLRFGEAAYVFIHRERGLDRAGARLHDALSALVAEAAS